MTESPEHYPLKGTELPQDEVHVWHLHYDRHCGRQPLLALLSRYLSLPQQQIRLAEGEHGRPMLALGFQTGLDFNWSHSGQHAVVAVARRLAVGVDVECLRPRPSALALAQRFFHRDEAATLCALPEDRQSHEFLRLWTGKEAILKAMGRGIAFGLDRVVLENQGTGELRLSHLQGEDPAAWQLHPLQLPMGLIGAIAWHGGPAMIRYHSLITQSP